MDDHTRWLVYDSDVFIFVQDIESDLFGSDPCRRRRRNPNDDRFARLDSIGRLHPTSIDLPPALLDERLNACAAHRRELRRNEAVQALAGLFGGNDQLDSLAPSSCGC